MIFAVLSEAADRGQLLLVEGGLCRFHRRRDGVVVIRELLVLPARRRQRIGRGLVREVLCRAGNRPVQARCPVAYEAGNAFWKAMAFHLMAEKDGINLWQRPAYPT